MPACATKGSQHRDARPHLAHQVVVGLVLDLLRHVDCDFALFVAVLDLRPSRRSRSAVIRTSRMSGTCVSGGTSRKQRSCHQPSAHCSWPREPPPNLRAGCRRSPGTLPTPTWYPSPGCGRSSFAQVSADSSPGITTSRPQQRDDYSAGMVNLTRIYTRTGMTDRRRWRTSVAPPRPIPGLPPTQMSMDECRHRGRPHARRSRRGGQRAAAPSRTTSSTSARTSQRRSPQPGASATAGDRGLRRPT